MNPQTFLKQVVAPNTTDEKIIGLAESVFSNVNEIVAKGTDSLLPVLHVLAIDPLKPNEPQMMLVALAGDDFENQKYEMMQAAGKAVFEQRMVPVMVSMVSEAWASTVTQNNRVWKHAVGRPSKDPNRIEVATVTVMTIEGKGTFIMGQIERENPDNAQSKITRVNRDERKPEIDPDMRSHANLLCAFFAGYMRSLAS